MLSVGIGVGYFGLVWAVLGFLTLIYPASIEHEDYWFAVGAMALLAVIPWTFSAIFLVPGIRGRRRLRRLQELAVHLRQAGQLDHDAIEQALHINAKARERLIDDAVGLGILEGVGEGAGVAALGPVIKGAYRVESVVRSGVDGGLYRVRQVRTGQGYMLRILLPGEELDEARIRALERRTLALSSLEHPVISRVIDMDVSEQGERFMVIDLAAERTLAERLEVEGFPPQQEALDFARELADAIAVAHAEGLPHGQLDIHAVFLAAAPGGERPVLLPWDWSLDQGVAAQRADLDALYRIIRRLFDSAEIPSALVHIVDRSEDAAGEDALTAQQLVLLLMECTRSPS